MYVCMYAGLGFAQLLIANRYLPRIKSEQCVQVDRFYD